MHARNKPIDRSNDDAVLQQVGRVCLSLASDTHWHHPCQWCHRPCDGLKPDAALAGRRCPSVGAGFPRFVSLSIVSACRYTFPSQVADLTIGYSGADLANLLNEGAILAVSANGCLDWLPLPLRWLAGCLCPCTGWLAAFAPALVGWVPLPLPRPCQ